MLELTIVNAHHRFSSWKSEVRKMESTDAQLVEILEKQIEVEDNTLAKISEAESTVTETAVRLVFLEMRLDSYKHKKFLEGLVDILKETPCDTWSAKIQRYIDRVKLKRQLEELITEEKEMLHLTREAIRLMNDNIGEILLTHIMEDEERHTKDLAEIVRIVQTLPLQTVKGEKGSDIVCID